MALGSMHLIRKVGAGILDGILEIFGGLLGSYFGAMVAALVTIIHHNSGPAAVQSSIKSGFGIGFVFWALGVSFVNRVLVQGISRASIGKKVFGLELLSTGAPITWSRMISRWVLSFGSAASFGAGYLYAFFNADHKTLHDLISETDVVPRFESAALEVEYRDQLEPVTPLKDWRVEESKDKKAA